MGSILLMDDNMTYFIGYKYFNNHIGLLEVVKKLFAPTLTVLQIALLFNYNNTLCHYHIKFLITMHVYIPWRENHMFKTLNAESVL